MANVADVEKIEHAMTMHDAQVLARDFFNSFASCSSPRILASLPIFRCSCRVWLLNPFLLGFVKGRSPLKERLTPVHASNKFVLIAFASKTMRNAKRSPD